MLSFSLIKQDDAIPQTALRSLNLLKLYILVIGIHHSISIDSGEIPSPSCYTVIKCSVVKIKPELFQQIKRLWS